MNVQNTKVQMARIAIECLRVGGGRGLAKVIRHFSFVILSSFLIRISPLIFPEHYITSFLRVSAVDLSILLYLPSPSAISRR